MPPFARNCLVFIATVFGMLLAIPIIVLGLPFWVTSVLTRTIVPLCEPKVIRWPQIFQFDRSLGWRAKANLNCHCLQDTDDVFHVMTDEHGWPAKESIADSEVVVFGDSHAFGYGVDQESSFFRLNPNMRIKAVGVPGYDLVHELLLMEQLSSQLKGKLVVWFVYIGNDLYDNLSPEVAGYRTPFVRQLNNSGEWEIVRSHLSPAKWTTSIGCQSRSIYSMVLPSLHSETFLAERAYSACGFLFEKGYEICRSAGSRLVVVSIPAPFALSQVQIDKARLRWPYLKNIDPDLPDRKIGAICDKLGIQFVPLKQYLNIHDYKTRDDHWTEHGHQRVAEVLWDLYRDHVTPRMSRDSIERSLACTVHPVRGDRSQPTPPRHSTDRLQKLS